jgi:hypothetical protein
MNALRNTFLRSARQVVRTNATLAGKPSAVPVRWKIAHTLLWLGSRFVVYLHCLTLLP